MICAGVLEDDLCHSTVRIFTMRDDLCRSTEDDLCHSTVRIVTTRDDFVVERKSFFFCPHGIICELVMGVQFDIQEINIFCTTSSFIALADTRMCGLLISN
jgi:hypothetical protein